MVALALLFLFFVLFLAKMKLSYYFNQGVCFNLKNIQLPTVVIIIYAFNGHHIANNISDNSTSWMRSLLFDS